MTEYILSLELENDYRISECELYYEDDDYEYIKFNNQKYLISKDNKIFGYDSYQLCTTREEAECVRKQLIKKEIKSREEIIAECKQEIITLNEMLKEKLR